MLLVLCMIFAMVPSFAMASEGAEPGFTTELDPVGNTQEENLETLVATYEATFWTGEAADQPVNCATLKEALEMLNKDGRTRTGKEVVTLLKSVDIANRAGVYFNDGSGTSATYAIYVMQGGFTLDLGGYTIRTSAGFMQTYNTDGAKALYKTFTTDALKTVTVKNGTVMTSVEGIDANQSASDKAGRATINHQAGNLTFENIKLLGSYQNNILMNPSEDGVYGTFNVINCELFAPGADSNASVINVNKNNTVNIVDSKIGMQGKDGVVKFADTATVNISGDTTVYYYGEGCFTGSPVLPTGKVGVVGTGSYTTTTGLVLTDAKTWTVGDAAAGTLAAGFTADGASEVKYYFDTELTEDNTADKIYTTAEKAFAAALTAWKTAKKGTVNLYVDITATNRSLYPDGDDHAGMINLGSDEELVLNVADGVKITHADTVVNNAQETKSLYVASITGSGKLTVNGGSFDWSNANFIQIGGTSDQSFTGSITLNNVNATITKGKHLINNYGMGGSITINGGEIVVYNLNSDNAFFGSGLIVTITHTNALDSATVYSITGGAKLTTMQYYALRVGTASKVYVDDATVISQYQSSGAAGPEGVYYIAAGAKAGTGTGTSANYALKPVCLYPMSDSTKVSDIEIVTQSGEFTAPGAAAPKSTTTVTVTPKTEAEASYTTVGGQTTEYATFAEAALAMKAAGGGTVKLLKDAEHTVVSGDGLCTTTAYAISTTDISWTLDLNGHTLKVDQGAVRIYGTCDFKVISSASEPGTLITGNTSDTRNGFTVEDASASITLENVRVYADGNVVRKSVASAQGIKQYVKNSVLYSGKAAAFTTTGDSTIVLENSILAASGSAATLSAAYITVDADTQVFHVPEKNATNVAAVVTTDPAGLQSKTTENETFAASTYFTGMADATGMKKTVWAAEQMPAGTVASFTGADGVRHLYGVKETSGTYELTVDGVVDATTYAATFSDEKTATMYAFGLALIDANAAKHNGALTLYADVTVDITRNGQGGGVLKSHNSNTYTFIYPEGECDFVINLNGHTLTGESESTETKIYLFYLNHQANITINGGMDGVEGTDSNGNKIVGGGSGKIVYHNYLIRKYNGTGSMTLNGVDLITTNSSAAVVELRNGKRTGSMNFNGGSATFKYLSVCQSDKSSMAGSTFTIGLDKGFVFNGNAVYAGQMYTGEMLYPYDCTIYTNHSSDASVTDYHKETYIVRWFDSATDTSSSSSTTSDLRCLESINVTHTATKETEKVKHVFTRGNPVATYQADESAAPVTYYSWAEAKTAAKAGGIVTLLDDVDYTSANDYFLDIAVAKDLTLDMNGHTVESTKGIVAYNFSNKNTNTETVDCVLKVKNGTIITSAVSLNQKRGIMQLEGVKIIQTTANNPTVELGTQVQNSDIKIDVPATGEGSYIRNSEIYAANNWHAVILSNAGAGNKPHLTVENSIIATADDNNSGYAIGVRYKSHYTGLIVDLKGVNKFYTYNTVTEMAPSANITFTGMPVSAMKSGQKYTFSGADGYSAENLNMWETTYTGGFTYTTAAGESTWYAELGTNSGLDKENGTIDSAYEALYNDPNGGGTITFFESVFYGDKAKYGDTEEITLADGTKEMAKVDSTFVDKNVNNGYVSLLSTRDFTFDLNGHGMFMCDEAISTPNYGAVLLGFSSSHERTNKIEMKNGTVVWAGSKRPFCLGTGSTKDTSYTLTMTDIFYENKGVSGASGNEAFYVQDKSTVILDGGYYKDSGDTSNTDGDGIVCVNDQDRAATVILRNGVVLESCRNAAISLKGDDDVLKIESDLGATIKQAKKADTAADMVAGSGSVNIGTLTFLAPKETSAPYKHEVKLVSEVAYYFAPNADTSDLTKGTGYDSFKGAFAKAMQDGGTVKLIKDIDLFSEYAVTELPLKLVDGTKPITIDLNEFSIYCSKNMAPDGKNTTTGWKNFIYLYGDASLAIKNGTFKWSGSTVLSAYYDSENSKQWTGKIELTDVDFANVYAGKCIALYSAAGEVIVSGGSIMSRNAPFTTTAKDADNTTKVTLKDGAVIETYSAYAAYNPDTNTGTECFAFRMAETAPYESKMTISLEDVVIWSQNPNKGKITTPGFEDQLKLAPGAEFFISASATEKTFEYMGYADGRKGNVYMHSASVAVAEYTDGAGVTTKHPDLYSAFQASVAYYETLTGATNTTDVGTVKLISDVVIDEGTPMGTYGFGVNLGGGLTFDLNGHKVSTADGFTLDRTFFILTTRDTDLRIKNGSVDMHTTSDFVRLGNSSSSPVANVIFENMYIDIHGDGDMVESLSSNASVTFDGGHYKTHSAAASKTYVIRTSKQGSTATTLQIYVKGGAILEQYGFHGYVLSFCNTKTQQTHIYSGAFTSYGGYIYSSGQLQATAVMYDADGNPITVTPTGTQTYQAAFMTHWQRKVVTPSIYLEDTNPDYHASSNLYCYNMEPGTAEQQADSVVKSEATGLYYNVNDLLNYMDWMTADDTLTAVADVDMSKSNAAVSGIDATLAPTMALTLELGGFTFTGDITSAEALAVNGGIVSGDVSADSGITVEDTTIGGDLTVNGGEMSLTNTNVRGDLAVNAAGAHLISGGTIAAAAPVQLAKDAVLTVADNATIDGSNGAAAQGEGAIIFKEAVVKFATGTEPYGTMITEGFCTDSDNGTVTTRTYTKAGDVVQGTNVAMLVENETYFATIKEAHDAASKLTHETVLLVADTTEPAFTIDREIVIDLGGFKAFTEITAASEGVLISNGTLATANGDAVTVTDGDTTLSEVTVSATGSALVVNGANAAANVYASKLTGDTNIDDTGYAIDVQAAANVFVSETTILSGAVNHAGIAVGANVAYEVVTVESGDIYIPKAYYEATRQWAEGQEKITCLVNTVSRYAYDMTFENDADGTSSRNSFYVASAAAPAAMIGKVGYATLKEAIDAAKQMNDAEIVLMRDIHIDDEYADTINYANTTSVYLITLNKAMTIDFNGFTVYGARGGRYQLFNVTGGATVRMKNGTIDNRFPEAATNSAKGDYTIANNANLYLDDMNIYAWMYCINSSTSNSTAKFYINGGTFVSDSRWAAFSNTPNKRTNPEWFVTGGAKFISMASDTSSTYVAGVTSQYTGFCIDDAYIYYNASADATKLANALPKDAPYEQLALPEGANGVEQTGHMAVDENGNKIASLLATYTEMYNGESFTVNYYGVGNVAKIADTEYASLDAALTAAAADNATDPVVLLKDVTVNNNVEIPAGETLNLNGKKVTFTTVGFMTIIGAMNTNGGTIESEGNVSIAAGATIDGYAYRNAALLNTKLNLQAVSLSLNDYVDINLKYSETDTASFNGAVVNVDGTAVNLAKTANGYNVYKIENLTAADYAAAKWVIMEANAGNDACVGLPVKVSVLEYAKKVVAANDYGIASDLGMTMTALMDYAGSAIDNAVHTDIADFGTAMSTDNGVLSVAGDFTNGYALKVTSTTAGTVTVAHTDVYGKQFTQNFTVTAGETVTYTMMHVADAKQTVTVTLTVDGVEASKLETTLASAASGADKAIVVSNLAEKFFTGK